MNTLQAIYKKLYGHFGPQHWWPGDTPFEVAIGAILTQSTNWGNVEQAIRNLKSHNLLSPRGMHELSMRQLASLIRPAGYFNVKVRRLKAFLAFLMNDYRGKMDTMAREETAILRTKLLRVYGIGPETADSILLYAFGRPVFVIDAYTKRILSRHGVMAEGKSYDEFQDLFHDFVDKDVSLYNEYHALVVKAGKTYCRKTKPLCAQCPLNDID